MDDGIADCAERCINTEGGFYCGCNEPGYEVIRNNATCQGQMIPAQIVVLARW